MAYTHILTFWTGRRVHGSMYDSYGSMYDSYRYTTVRLSEVHHCTGTPLYGYTLSHVPGTPSATCPGTTFPGAKYHIPGCYIPGCQYHIPGCKTPFS